MTPKPGEIDPRAMPAPEPCEPPAPEPDELDEEPLEPMPTGLEPTTPLTTRAPRARQRPG